METISYVADDRETVPVSAIVIHRHRDQFVAVQHEVETGDEGGAPYLTDGRLCSLETLRDLHNRLSGNKLTRQLLPACVLVADADMLVWHRPAARRPIFFQTNNKAFNEEMSGKVVLHPPLLFVGRPRSLHVYALDSNARPTDETRVYRAPYYNVYASGLLCEGNAPLPKAPLANMSCIVAYESALHDASFTHTNLGSAQILKWNGGHNALWRAMAETEDDFFPVNALLTLTDNDNPVTLERILNGSATFLAA